MILVSGATKTVRAMLAVHPNLGVLLTPATRNLPPGPEVTWAADNAAYSGFDARVYRRFLARIEHAPGCRWVAVPDVVGDADATLRLWREWRPIVADHGLVPALVAQDGLTHGRIPWLDVGAIFIGGSTTFKLSAAAAEIVREANARTLWTHMGRVNTAKRLLYAAAIGCRSVDGSSFSLYARTHLPWALRVLQQLPLGLEAVS